MRSESDASRSCSQQPRPPSLMAGARFWASGKVRGRLGCLLGPGRRVGSARALRALGAHPGGPAAGPCDGSPGCVCVCVCVCAACVRESVRGMIDCTPSADGSDHARKAHRLWRPSPSAGRRISGTRSLRVRAYEAGGGWQRSADRDGMRRHTKGAPTRSPAARKRERKRQTLIPSAPRIAPRIAFPPLFRTRLSAIDVSRSETASLHSPTSTSPIRLTQWQRIDRRTPHPQLPASLNASSTPESFERIGSFGCNSLPACLPACLGWV